MNKLDVKGVVADIRREIGRKKVLQMRRFSGMLSDVIDVGENEELLLDGWYFLEKSDADYFRWTQKEFSFLCNLHGSPQMMIEILMVPGGVEKKALGLELWQGRRRLSSRIIAKSGPQIVRFDIPGVFRNRNLEFRVKLSYDFVPGKRLSGGDKRSLGVGVKRIYGAYYLGETFNLISELSKLDGCLVGKLGDLRIYGNPENSLPQEVRLRLIKRLILRIIRVYSVVQTSFNSATGEILETMVNYLSTLTDYCRGIDKSIREIQERQKDYRKTGSVYWNKDEEDFYMFHQNFFRGTYGEVGRKLDFYLQFLEPIGAYKENVFVDFGCGRGEFLEILGKRGVRAMGVDLNRRICVELKKKGLAVVNDDAISFLKGNEMEFGGVSAFHFIEHLSFADAYDFLKMVYLKLKDGGVVMLETPNIDNLMVAAERFYFDYDHKTKFPPILLQKMMEFIGYKEIKVIPLHLDLVLTDDVGMKLSGYQDYAIVARKNL